MHGEPHQLLCDPNSYWLRLVEHTGPVTAERLKNMAQTAHLKVHQRQQNNTQNENQLALKASRKMVK